jgi:cytochrome c-type biogenesis protein CcmH/NrfG
MMAGQAAYQSGNYAAAIGYWNTVLTVLPSNSPDVELIRSEIADAQLKMRGPAKP